MSSGAARGPTSGVALESEPEIIREARGKGVNIWDWDEEGNIDPSSGERPDLFTVGSPDVWGAAGSGLMASTEIR